MAFDADAPQWIAPLIENRLLDVAQIGKRGGYGSYSL